MLSLEIRFNKNVNYNIGSRLQGYIMEKIDSDYATLLHDSNFHSYTQYIEQINDNSSIWHINMLDDNAVNSFEKLFYVGEKVFLDNNNEYEIISIDKRELSYKQLLNELCVLKPNRYVNIKILTPVSFKTNGEYYYFPNIKLVFNSIMMRYNMFSTEFSLEDTDILDEIVDNFIICDYNIRTKLFYLEKIKIKGFVGNITIKMNGTVQLANIGNMLLKYAEFTGIGIKTSMGMGGVKILKENNRG